MTGATGFTGGHLAATLARRGDLVRALVRPKSRSRFDRSPLPTLGVEAVDGDLGDPASVQRAAGGVDVVYHIAATYREAGQPDSSYRAINVEAAHLPARLNRAGVLFQLGRFEEAAKEYGTLLQVAPGHPAATAGLRACRKKLTEKQAPPTAPSGPPAAPPTEPRREGS